MSCMGKYGVAKAIVYDLAVTFRTYLSVGNFVVGTFFPKLLEEASILLSELGRQNYTIVLISFCSLAIMPI